MRNFGRAVVLMAGLGACNRTPSPSGDPLETGTRSGDAREDVRYLALGDSFTAGTGNLPAEAFPSRLAERWRATRRVTLENLAVNGYTTDDVASREIPEVGAFHPTLVTLAIGANDRVRGSTADAYRGHVRAILHAIVDSGVPPLHIVTLPQPEWSSSPAAASFGDPQKLGADIVAFNAVLREETAAVGARYVDLFPLMHRQAEAKSLASDGLHPSARAHDEWAAALFEAIAP